MGAHVGRACIHQSHNVIMPTMMVVMMCDDPPMQAADPMLSREYSKLFTAASKVSDVSGCAVCAAKRVRMGFRAAPPRSTPV